MTEDLLQELNRQFAIADHLHFERHPSGLIQGRIKTAKCSGSFFLLGGHLAEFQPASQQHPVLFMSGEAVYEVGKPIRGGIPVCFPWFGPNKADATLPAHGTVRTELWNVLRSEVNDRGVAVVLGYESRPFRVEMIANFGETLDVTLTAQNESQATQPCEVALHTYFQLGDVRRAQVSGLEQNAFRDQLTGQVLAATGDAIRFTEETDRVYRGEVGSITIEDEAYERRIKIAPRNSESTVVWNPWIAKSQRMADFGDQEFETMCCIETANVAPNGWNIDGGESRSIGFEISVT